MHIDLDISTVAGHVNLGGIDQPIIGQRKAAFDIRLHEGEVNLLGGLINQQDSHQITGIPGLNSIPLLRRLFSGESTSHERDELMIVLVPHVVRQPDISAGNLRPIAVGNAQAVKLSYAPKASDMISGPAAAAVLQGNAPAPGTAMPPAAVRPATTPPATAPAAPPVAPPATAPPLTTPATPTSPPATAPPPVTGPPMTTPPATAPPDTAATTPATTPPAGTARVTFSPAQVETRMGGSVSVSLILDGGTDVASAPLTIKFDPQKLKLNDVVRGDFLASDGQMPVFTKNIMNDTGSATIQLNRQPGTPGVNGGGVLVTLNFQAVSRGMTVVNVPGLMIRNSLGQPIADGNPQLTISVQ